MRVLIKGTLLYEPAGDLIPRVVFPYKEDPVRF
jgi:hypothetical protein